MEARGVVTCYDSHFNLCFIHDGTANLYVQVPTVGTPPQVGQFVGISGVAWQGLFAPFLNQPQIQSLGTAPLPEPLRPSEGDLLSGSLDAQWVEVRGVVRSQRRSADKLRLEVVSGQTRFSAWILHTETNATVNLTDRLVRLRGVSAAQVNEQKEPNGFRLFLNSLAEVEVLSALPVDMASLRPSLAKDLSSYSVRRQTGHRLRMQGVVIARLSETGFLMRDPTGVAEVQCGEETSAVPGDVVNVTGFLTVRPCAVRLEDASAEKIGNSELPNAIPLAGVQSVTAVHHHQVIELEGQLLGRFSYGPHHIGLSLQCGTDAFKAWLFSTNTLLDLARLEAGSRLRLTGVCRLEGPGKSAGDAAACEWCGSVCTIPSKKNLANGRLHLWLRSPADVQVLAGPVKHHYDVARVALVISILIGSTGILSVAFLARRRRLEMERIMARHMTLQNEIRDNERQIRRSLEERERLAQDLHDDIIQSIYSVGLNLETCKRQSQAAPEQIESRLSGAIHTLNDTIRTVRGFITGLEPKVLNGRELKTALKSLALVAGETQSLFSIEVDSGVASQMSSEHATQLLHIAKEAMSNAQRHARASHITVSLKRAPQGWQLEIEDDGVGFDPAAPPSRGQGLRNMADRAQAIGARMEVITTPGQGCRIAITSLPLKTP